jgi:FAD binding domain/Berberine and berberine like
LSRRTNDVNSFEGWSALNGSLVIDVSSINYVHVSEDLATATIGAGTNLGEIYTKLSTYGKTFLGGICPTVALGGYLGAGGYNLQQRQLGLAVDQIVSFKAVTARGELINVSPTENPDLWWAARGGGTYAIVAEATVKILTLPRSAMVAGFFNDKSTRYDVVKKYLDWAPKQPAEFTSQLNVYSNRTHLIGWHLGGGTEQLQNLMADSGLFDVPGANISITGNCSTENSRMFWMDPHTTCTDDDQAYESFLQAYNTKPIHLAPIEPQFRVEDQAALPSEPTAKLWPRFPVISKTYFTLKSSPLSDDVLAAFVERTGGLEDDFAFWGEWTSFNISNPTTTGSFPWLEESTTLMRMEVAAGQDSETFAKNREWMLDFDRFFRPQAGWVMSLPTRESDADKMNTRNASYSGYIDADLSVNPLTSYYGENICRLIKVKNMYDPGNFFKNPFSVPTSVPAGISC